MRLSRPGLHRIVGRLYLVGVGVGAVGAIATSIWSTLGLKGFFGFAALDILWVGTAWQAYRAVRRHDYRSHRAWMIRNFALTFAAVVLRVELFSLLGLQALVVSDWNFEHAYDQAYGPLPYLAWIPNLVIAEWLIYRRRLPGLRYSTSPSAS